MTNMFKTSPPPPTLSNFSTVPLVHKLCEFYKTIYTGSRKVNKRDRFGIYLKIENLCLEIIDLGTTAALESKTNKFPILNTVRIKIEILKRLIRISHELNIIDQKRYIRLEADLQELSKMANGWIKYLK